MYARYCMMSLVVSVLPAPDSPDTRIDWLFCSQLGPPPPRRSVSHPHRACSFVCRAWGM